MATAAAGADVVILVLDASAGIKPQTELHLSIAYRLGVRKFIVVANKFDLVNYSSKVYSTLRATVGELFQTYQGAEWVLIPASGTEGSAVVKRGSKMRWYQGPTILEALDSSQPYSSPDGPATLAVQMVQRLGNRRRQYFGSVLRGTIREGLELTIYPGNAKGTISELTVSGSGAREAPSGYEIGFELKEERDVERGAVLSEDPEVISSHHWDAIIIWLDAEEGIPGRPYLAKMGYQSHRVTISRASEVSSHLDRGPEAKSLKTNGTYRVTVSGQQDFTVAPFETFPEAGRFVLINPENGQTAGVGLVNYSLRRSENVLPHNFGLDQSRRETLTGGEGRVLWLTGLSGSGKSTIADAVTQRLTNLGRLVTVLDGDNLRTGLNSDLGFTETDRVENIRRTAEVAKIFAETGIVVAVSLISPYRQDRARARDIIRPDRFAEIFVSTPLSICEKRDPKGLYKKARSGEIPNFTGIDAPYEEPLSPDLVVEGSGDLEEQVTKILSLLGA